MKEVAPGITLLKRYGPFKNGCWILSNQGQAAVVEMPPYLRTERPPFVRAESFTRRRKLRLKYAMLTHCHYDHCASLMHFRRAFPRTTFVGHQAVAHDSAMRRWFGEPDYLDEVFEGELWTGDLGGEPIHLLFAPKHSYTDHLVLFRGAVIAGDWVLGDLRDCNAIVATEHKLLSVERVRDLLRRLNYRVHMAFSGHGDHLFYQVDFERLLERSRR